MWVLLSRGKEVCESQNMFMFQDVDIVIGCAIVVEAGDGGGGIHRNSERESDEVDAGVGMDGVLRRRKRRGKRRLARRGR